MWFGIAMRVGAVMSTSGGTSDRVTGAASGSAVESRPADESQQAQSASGPQPPAGGEAGAGTRAPQWRKVIVGLVIALVMGTIMVTTYVSAEHGVVAHNLPWGQTGPSPLTSAVQKNVSMKIHTYANQSDLVNAANHATIYGGFVPQSNTLVINEAASLWAPGVMPAAYLKAARAQGIPVQSIHVSVINRLPSQDPEGVVPGLVVFVLLVAGYLGSTLAMQRSRRSAAHRRVALLTGYAIVAALIFNLIVGPGLNAYPHVGSNFWPLWGEFALICLAVALLTGTLQSLIGPIGTLVTVILVVFLGNPSTGGVNGTAYLPAFWQGIGPILPPWNGVILIRNTLYFDRNSITQQLIVLSIYVVAGAVLMTIFGWGRLFWWRGPNNAITRDEEVGIAAVPPG